jgi:hypothetical protein
LSKKVALFRIFFAVRGRAIYTQKGETGGGQHSHLHGFKGGVGKGEGVGE